MSESVAAVPSSGGTSSAGRSTPEPKKFCGALLPDLQKLVKIPLTRTPADDATSDPMHRGEAGYLSYVTNNGAYRVAIIMSDEKSLTKASQPGYTPLPDMGAWRPAS